MRLIYILLASGLLMLLKVSTEPPPLAPFYAVAHARAMDAEKGMNDWSQSLNKDVPFELAIDTPKVDGFEDGYQSVTTKRYPSEVSNFSPSHTKLDTLYALYPTEAQNEPFVADGPDMALPEKATPTAMPKATTAPVDKVMESYRQSSPLPMSGYAMYYNPNVMQEVLNNRLAMGHVSSCNECVGNIALLRAGDLNRRVWLQWSDGTVEGPFLVADVAAPQHVAQLLARNWVVDVDYRTASRRGMVGPEMVTVLASPPAGNVSHSEPFAPLYAAPTPIPTDIPTATPLPVVSVEPSPTPGVVQGGFPPDTPVPTVTPLPVIDETVPPTAVVTQGGFPPDTPVPTVTPLPALSSTYTPTYTPVALPTIAATLPPTATVVPTVTPVESPTGTAQESPTHTVVTQGGFPPDTPVPTVTPLPPINQSSEQEGGGDTPTPTN